MYVTQKSKSAHELKQEPGTVSLLVNYLTVVLTRSVFQRSKEEGQTLTLHKYDRFFFHILTQSWLIIVSIFNSIQYIY